MNSHTGAVKKMLLLASALVATVVWAQTPVTNSPATNAPAAAATVDTAAIDKLWREIWRAAQPPAPPAEWAGKPTPEQLEAFRGEKGRQAAVAADKMKDFYTRYPAHAKAAEARKQYAELLKWATTYGVTGRVAELKQVEVDRLKDPNLSEAERFKLRHEMVERAFLAKRKEGQDAYFAEMEKGARELIKEFPNRVEGPQLLLNVAKYANEVKARALVKEILAGNGGEEIKDEANGLLRRLDALGKPVDIKFTALDGREVDLAAMKGKVVLIDFWATWCGPCVEEIPTVKAAYDKLHGKGFEIVAISFDSDKAKLEEFVAENKMAWPQYFDGKGWGNKFGKQFGISGIPTMWLVDKKGLLREMNARSGLEKKVAELLAE